MKLINEHRFYIEFAVGCALKVLPIFEKKYPEDKRPREAIIAAWNFFLNPSIKNNKDAAHAAAYAAAHAAVHAAYAAAYAAHAAAYAAHAAADAADAAADAAAYAAYGRKWQVEFLASLNIKYGLDIKIRGIE